MNEVTFRVEACADTGGLVARWDEPRGGGITRQGEGMADLHAMIAGAVTGSFEPGEQPAGIGQY